MPPDLTIGPLQSPAQEALRASAVAGARAFPQAAAATAPTSNIAAAGAPALPENRVVLDPASDRVVLEYFDATGALVNSLPSQRQLDAYRLAAATTPNAPSEIKKT